MDRARVLQTPSLGGPRISFSRRIFGKFQIQSLLLSNSLPPRLPLLMLKFQKELEWMRRLSFLWKPSPPRTPLPSRMWSPKPRMQSWSLRPRVLNSRKLILRRTFHRRRPRYRIFFCNGILPSFVTHFPLINEGIFLLIVCLYFTCLDYDYCL